MLESEEHQRVSSTTLFIPAQKKFQIYIGTYRPRQRDRTTPSNPKPRKIRGPKVMIPAFGIANHEKQAHTAPTLDVEEHLY